MQLNIGYKYVEITFNSSTLSVVNKLPISSFLIKFTNRFKIAPYKEAIPIKTTIIKINEKILNLFINFLISLNGISKIVPIVSHKKAKTNEAKNIKT